MIRGNGTERNATENRNKRDRDSAESMADITTSSSKRDIPHSRVDQKKRRSEGSSEMGARQVWGNIPLEEEIEQALAKPVVLEEDKVKANFGLSGALAKDEVTGNMHNGVLLKWNEPLDAAMCNNTQWRLYVFKGDTIIESIHLQKKSAFLFGRDKRVADVLLLHPASSKQHAVIQFRKVSIEGTVNSIVKPYLMDLQSANKTFLNGTAIEDSRYYELREKDSLRFGLSDREFILIAA